MLVLSRQRYESIVINDNIVVTVIEIRGDKVRLGIECPKEVPIHRREVYEALVRERQPPKTVVYWKATSREEEVFIQEIDANPKDEARYLVYADWLEERGDPKAEYIRLGCQLTKLSWQDPEFLPARERMAELRRTLLANEWT